MSFDPVHDSIVSNKSSGDSSSTYRTSSLNSLLNPTVPSNKTEAKEAPEVNTHSPKKFEDKRTKISSLITGNETHEKIDPEPEESLKSHLKDPEPKDTNHGYQTLLVNSRTRHLKKDDGEPYWRREVQFTFLFRLLLNRERVFINPYYGTDESYDWPDHFKKVRNSDGSVSEHTGQKVTFFELYLITLLKSSKVSKILKDRLLVDINYALNFCVICLLVNIGRLNTTVNFDYEMKSQFRTYHPIPCLQVGNHLEIIQKYYCIDKSTIKIPGLGDDSSTDTSDDRMKSASTSFRSGSGYTMSTVKQLQDTPRIKSILKSVNDLNTRFPKNFAELAYGVSSDGPFDLNIVSLIFLLCAHEIEISKTFFSCKEEDHKKESQSFDEKPTVPSSFLFNDIWLETNFRAEDKVKRFLWLIYMFKETNFRIDAILANPFNRPGHLNRPDDFNPEADIVEEIVSHNEFVLGKIKALVPELRFVDKALPVDPYLNDVDTDDEIAFGQHMKDLRLEFVKREQVIRRKKKEATASNAKPIVEHKGEDDTSNKIIHIEPKVKLSEDSNNLLDAEEIHHHVKKIGESPLHPRSKHKSASLKRKFNALTQNSKAGSLGPCELKEMELAFEKAIKRRKKTKLQLPFRLDRKEIEDFFNGEIKAINLQSKNAASKRHRNNVYALFIKNLYNYKMDQIQARRLKEGNLKRFDHIDPNMMIDINTKNDPDNWGDFSEFKTHYFKELNRINAVINYREMSKMADPKVKHDGRVRHFRESTSFIDEAMKQIDD